VNHISKSTLSIIAPVYNEHLVIKEFVSRLLVQLRKLKNEGKLDSFEVILVNDGSTDKTTSILEEICSKETEVICLDLSRNFGHQFAISAGIDMAEGDRVVIMDSDLQDPPEELPRFLEKLEEGYDVVYGVRRTRKENFIKKFCYAAFYRMLRLLSSIEIPLDSGDYCAMSRQAADNLRKFPERNRFMRGLRSWIGLKQIGLEYDRDARFAGKPKYTIRTLIKLALDGLVAFSYRPLRAIALVGIFVSLASFALAIFYAFQRIQFGLAPPGFASTMVAIFFFAGLQLITLGIIGEYIGRIYEEVKQRPHYLIKRVIGQEKQP
jgi:glycosyltransferase involved in cell wall biosynthesis